MFLVTVFVMMNLKCVNSESETTLPQEMHQNKEEAGVYQGALYQKGLELEELLGDVLYLVQYGTTYGTGTLTYKEEQKLLGLLYQELLGKRTKGEKKATGLLAMLLKEYEALQGQKLWAAQQLQLLLPLYQQMLQAQTTTMLLQQLQTETPLELLPLEQYYPQTLLELFLPYAYPLYYTLLPDLPLTPEELGPLPSLVLLTQQLLQKLLPKYQGGGKGSSLLLPHLTTALELLKPAQPQRPKYYLTAEGQALARSRSLLENESESKLEDINGEKTTRKASHRDI